MKNSNDIRNEFFDFFKSKKHTLVSSAPLMPTGDSTLLFTNAGMNQFKDIFEGSGKRDYTRAVDSQKCMRVSGKHNDLDDVGRDTTHHTFFEMLGNWSFGDYYKKEAISWAWELLTEVWKLPKEKLWATVYKDDHEAFELWQNETDIDNDKILYFGDKDNFWEMGETGPCGPCSEIHFDLGEEFGVLKEGEIGVNGDNNRFIEIWNLVFIQYDRAKGGKLNPLPQQHVDTGMGFERIVSILQGKTSNYDTDLFKPLLNIIEEISGKSNQGEDGVAMRVIADHTRALVFSIADGIMPSNEGRGYVLRRILRRALRFGNLLGFSKPFLAPLIDSLISSMGDFYPEIVQNKVRISEVLQFEQESFYRTLYAGMSEAEVIIAKVIKAGGDTFPGDEAFKLYDSMGFPVDICEEIARDAELKFDKEQFNVLMEEQKSRGRDSWKGSSERDFTFLSVDLPATIYLSGEDTVADIKVLEIFNKDEIVSELTTGNEGYLISEKTPFYAEGGGQVSDLGIISGEAGEAEVLEVFKLNELFIHKVKINSGKIVKGMLAEFKVDYKRKRAIAAHHSATHLLQMALTSVLGEHIAQAGSLVKENRLRFDFNHFHKISSDELNQIEMMVNDAIVHDFVVNKDILNKDEAIKAGAKAFFGDKYGEKVRVVSIGDFSKELCGGTHVNRTGEIGMFKIISESSISSGVRRIEAVTGLAAVSLLQKRFDSLNNISASSRFKSNREKCC